MSLDGIAWKGYKEYESDMTLVTPVHWGKPYLDSLVSKGFIISPEAHTDLDASISKAELFVILDKITD